jgi:dihydrofolate reductase
MQDGGTALRATRQRSRPAMSNPGRPLQTWQPRTAGSPVTTGCGPGGRRRAGRHSASPAPTIAWGGRHPMNVTTVVLTHRRPPTVLRTTRTSSCHRRHRGGGGKGEGAGRGQNVAVNGGQMARQCLEAGLLDEVGVELVPVVLGGGRRCSPGSTSRLSCLPSQRRHDRPRRSPPSHRMRWPGPGRLAWMGADRMGAAGRSVMGP